MKTIGYIVYALCQLLSLIYMVVHLFTGDSDMMLGAIHMGVIALWVKPSKARKRL